MTVKERWKVVWFLIRSVFWCHIWQYWWLYWWYLQNEKSLDSNAIYGAGQDFQERKDQLTFELVKSCPSLAFSLFLLILLHSDNFTSLMVIIDWTTFRVVDNWKLHGRIGFFGEPLHFLRILLPTSVINYLIIVNLT